ncbi:type I polyketide synthase, partial [Nocardia sp. NPDC088792]|uniref:type I polyketide synthase n=1 Tax=Nocardia sp. NPDC088792 TaxID=3364332 RepID=UPI003803771F
MTAVAEAVGGRVVEFDGSAPTLKPADTGVVSLLAMSDEVDAVVDTLRLLQSVKVPLWAVTRGAVTAVPQDRVDSVWPGGVWGLARVAALELPDRWGGVIDLPADFDAAAARWLAKAVTGGHGEDQLAVRPSGLFARRLARMPASSSTWRTSGTALVTGGTGGVGAHVARWLTGSGAEHIVLLSRRGPDAEDAAELREELEATGAKVSIVAADVTDRATITRVLRDIPADLPLRTVVHAAGVVDDAGALDTLTPHHLQQQLGVKVAGALLLDELIRDVDLDAFVLFSSGAAAWGSAGQGGYATANACLDALASRRRAQGLVGTTVSWGAWESTGMMEADAGYAEYLERLGVTPMAPVQATAALERILGDDDVTATVTDMDWARFVPAFTLARPSLLFSLLAASGEADKAETANSAMDSLRAMSHHERNDYLLAVTREQVAVVLGYDRGDEVDPDQVFKDLGIDSVTAVDLRNRLQTVTGLSLPSTLVFDHPTVGRIVAYLADLAADQVGEIANAFPVAVNLTTDDPIVIVGMACRFPGGVAGPADLWRVVAAGVDVMSEFPDDRGWDVAALYDPAGDRTGTSVTREGGFLDDAGGFDAGFFGISPREALATDPQQRLLLETSWEALEHAGIDPASLAGSATGVFVGAAPSGYSDVVSGLEETQGHLLTGGLLSVLSGRIAYSLGLQGPAMSVDTACSSSLVSLHLAGQALRAGECSLALVGGIAVMATPGGFIEFSRQGGLSADGRCKAFADAADGTGWSEGVGVLVVQRLSDARAAGRRVLAVVRSSAV